MMNSELPSMSKVRKTTRGSSRGECPPPPERIFKASHSKIKLARRCLKAYEYRYVKKIERRLKSRPLLVGTLVHTCLESYFRDGYYLPAIREWEEKVFTKMFVEERALHSDVIPLVKNMMRGYLRKWKESNLDMVWVEKDFDIQIGTAMDSEGNEVPVYLNGKIDGRAKEKGTRRQWLVEHKTCKKMPGEEVRIFDTQVILYSGVLEEMGEDPVDGVVWDYLRTKLPSVPQLLKSGGLSQAKSIDTTREVFEREIRRHGLDVRGYRGILEHLDSQRDQFFRQVKLPLPGYMAKEVRADLASTAQQLILLEDLSEGGLRVFTRNLTRDCSWCDYSNICHASLRGEDTDYIMKHDYQPRKKDEKVIEVE